jgi:hypothetical protein
LSTLAVEGVQGKKTIKLMGLMHNQEILIFDRFWQFLYLPQRESCQESPMHHHPNSSCYDHYGKWAEGH